MGAFTYHSENALSVARSRLYKALVLDFNSLIPKIMEAAQVNVQILEGNGSGTGTLKKITFLEGGETKYVVEKLELVDEASYVCKYTTLEGSGLPEGVETAKFETKIEEGANGGSLAKVTTTYFTKTDAPLADEALANAKARNEGFLRAVEAYLLAHPDY